MDYNNRNQRLSPTENAGPSPKENLSFLGKVKKHIEEKWFEWISAVGIGLFLIWLALQSDEKLGDIRSILGQLENIASIFVNSHQFSPVPPPPPPIPVPSPVGPQTAWITNQTPYFIELDSSGKYSSIFENYLSQDLQLYDSHMVTNVSDAAVILKVGDVSENSQALYSDSVLEETPAYDTPPPQSTIAVHLTLQRVDGSRAPFDGDFTCQKSVSPSSPDNNPGEVDTLAQKDIAFSIYQYLVGKTDKLTCSP